MAVPAATGVTTWLPLVGIEPVHAPLAAHELELDEDQLSVDVFPKVMVAGSSEMVIVGAVVQAT